MVSVFLGLSFPRNSLSPGQALTPGQTEMVLLSMGVCPLAPLPEDLE